MSNKFESVRDMVMKYQNSNKTAFEFQRADEIVKVTYQQFCCDIDQCIPFLPAAEHVGLAAANSYEWCVLALAVLCSGTHVLVPIDASLPAEDMKCLLDKADVDVLYYSRTGNEKQIDGLLELLGGTVPVYELMEEVNRYLGSEVPQDFKLSEIDPDRLALLIFTSGTSSDAKAVMVNQTCLAAPAKINEGKDVMELEEYRYLLILPLSHTFGLRGVLLPGLMMEGTICFTRGRRYLFEDFPYFNPTSLYGSPGMLAYMVNMVEKNGKTKEQVFGNKLMFICCGSAPFPDEIESLIQGYGYHIINGYGMTECTAIASSDPMDRAGNGLLIWAALEFRLAPGTNEIQVRGDMVAQGYYKDEEATAEVWEDGWFRTGDVGQLLEPGRLLIKGRLKNMLILSNGIKIFPEELENLLQKDERVKEAMVYLVEQRELRGKLVLEEQSDTTEQPGSPEQSDTTEQLAQDIVQRFNQGQPAYRRLTEVEVVKALPRNSMGKLQRFKEV